MRQEHFTNVKDAIIIILKDRNPFTVNQLEYVSWYPLSCFFKL